MMQSKLIQTAAAAALLFAMPIVASAQDAPDPTEPAVRTNEQVQVQQREHARIHADRADEATSARIRNEIRVQERVRVDEQARARQQARPDRPESGRSRAQAQRDVNRRQLRDVTRSRARDASRMRPRAPRSGP